MNLLDCNAAEEAGQAPEPGQPVSFVGWLVRLHYLTCNV